MPAVALVDECEIANVQLAPDETTYTRETRFAAPPSLSSAKYTALGAPPVAGCVMITSKQAYVLEVSGCAGNRMWSSGALLCVPTARPVVTWISVPAPL